MKFKVKVIVGFIGLIMMVAWILVSHKAQVQSDPWAVPAPRASRAVMNPQIPQTQTQIQQAENPPKINSPIGVVQEDAKLMMVETDPSKNPPMITVPVNGDRTSMMVETNATTQNAGQ